VPAKPPGAHLRRLRNLFNLCRAMKEGKREISMACIQK